MYVFCTLLYCTEELELLLRIMSNDGAIVEFGGNVQSASRFILGLCNWGFV